VAAVSDAGGCGVLGAGEGSCRTTSSAPDRGGPAADAAARSGVDFVIAPLDDTLASAEERQRLCQ
jgi:hypothetical protein